MGICKSILTDIIDIGSDIARSAYSPLFLPQNGLKADRPACLQSVFRLVSKDRTVSGPAGPFIVRFVPLFQGPDCKRSGRTAHSPAFAVFVRNGLYAYSTVLSADNSYNQAPCKAQLKLLKLHAEFFYVCASRVSSRPSLNTTAGLSTQ
jgi:hypothetical protein